MEKISAIEPLGGNGLFNSVTEIGMRILFILDAFYPYSLDLTSLSVYDYYVVYTEDIGGPVNLHVPSASRSGEFLVRRKGIQRALLFLHRTNLVELAANEQGYAYKITQEATGLLDVSSAPYHEKLRERAAWLSARRSSDSSNVDHWMRKLADEIEKPDIRIQHREASQ